MPRSADRQSMVSSPWRTRCRLPKADRGVAAQRGDQPVAYQFLHVEIYARARSGKSKSDRWTVRDIFAELNREPGACPHVADARSPLLRHGEPPAEVERQLLAGADAA